MGQRIDLCAPFNTTIRQLRVFLATKHGVDAERFGLVRRERGQYIHLDDHKTVAQYQMRDHDRLLIIPKARAGPIGDTSRSASPSLKVLHMDEKEKEKIIDKLLQDAGHKKKENCTYVLAQMDYQKAGDYTIIEMRVEEDKSAQSSKSSIIPIRAQTQSELNQKEKTPKRMWKLKEDLKRRRAMNSAKTPNSKVDKSCATCRASPVDTVCQICYFPYCPDHIRKHACEKDRAWCRQQ